MVYQIERRKTFERAAEYPDAPAIGELARSTGQAEASLTPQQRREREAVAEAAKWVAGVTGLDAHPEHAHAAPAEAIDGDVAALEQWLASGEVLCALAHRLGGAEAARAVNAPNIDPSSSSSAAGAPAAASGEETISFYERSQRNAKRMEVVGRYLDAIRRIGVPEHDLFNSVDLVNGKDMRAVVRSLHSLGRVAQRIDGFEGPHLGARLSTKNTRTFSRSSWRRRGRCRPNSSAISTPPAPRPPP